MAISLRMIRSLSLAFALAASLAAPSVRAAGVDPGVATPVQREQAQARFQRGKELFTARSYGPALVEFRASLEIVASPNTRLYSARCYRQMGKLVEAYVEFGRTSVDAREHLAEDNRYQKSGEAAELERKDITPMLGFLSVSIGHPSESTTLKVGQDDIRRAGWSEPIPRMPGPVEVIVTSPGKDPLRQTVELVAGDKQLIAFDAQADGPAFVPPQAVASIAPATPVTTSSSREGLRPFAYVAGGIGVVGLATFAIAGLSSKSTYDDLAAACPSGPCPVSRQADIDSGKRTQTIANVGLVVGALGLAAGVTLFVVSTKPSAKPASAAFVVSPSWVGMRGAF